MIYDYKITTGKGETIDLSDYKGKVIMIVNTATGCGFTPQYEPIEKMYRDYHDKGLISRAISSARRHPEQMTRYISSAPCITTPHSHR